MATDTATVTMESHHRSFEWCHIADLLRPPVPPKLRFHMPQGTRYTTIAISPQRVIRYTSCLVGYGFQGRRIEWRYFRLHQIQVGGRPPSWIISNDHISPMTYSIHLYRAHRAVIFVIAQLSCFSLSMIMARTCPQS